MELRENLETDRILLSLIFPKMGAFTVVNGVAISPKLTGIVCIRQKEDLVGVYEGFTYDQLSSSRLGYLTAGMIPGNVRLLEDLYLQKKKISQNNWSYGFQSNVLLKTTMEET